MKSAAFEYARAASLAEACDWLREDGDDAKLIAGGQSLVPMMAMRLTRPARLDRHQRNRRAANSSRSKKTFARIGACTRQCVVERDDALAAARAAAAAGAGVGRPCADAQPRHRRRQPRARRSRGRTAAGRAGAGRDAWCCARTAGARTVAGRANSSPARWSPRRAPTNASRKSAGRSGRKRAPARRSPKSASATATSRMVAAAAQVALDADGRCVRASFRPGRRRLDAAGVSANSPRSLVGTQLEDDAIDSVAQRRRGRTASPAATCTRAPDYRRHLAGVLAARVLRAARDEARSTLMSEKLYPIAVEVNGKQRRREVPARLSLVDWLRDELRLTGTHVGCEHGICGACSVHARRRAGALLPDVRGAGRRPPRHHRRGPGASPTAR